MNPPFGTSGTALWRLGSVAAFAAVFAGIATGCGGTDNGRPTRVEAGASVTDPGSAPIVCPNDPTLETRLIEDFELGAASGGFYLNNEACERCKAYLPAVEPNSRGAGGAGGGPAVAAATTNADSPDWVACQAKCVGIMVPPIASKPVPASLIQPVPRCGSREALHVSGGPFNDWGIVIGVQFRPPLDASEWEGITFWGRVGPGSRDTVRLQISEAHTDEAAVDGSGTPVCVANVARDQLPKGCDKYGSYAVMGPNWRQFFLSFSEMRQSGWGKVSPFLDKAGLWSIAFSAQQGTWDIWLDDLALYRRKAK